MRHTGTGRDTNNPLKVKKRDLGSCIAGVRVCVCLQYRVCSLAHSCLEATKHTTHTATYCVFLVLQLAVIGRCRCASCQDFALTFKQQQYSFYATSLEGNHQLNFFSFFCRASLACSGKPLGDFCVLRVCAVRFTKPALSCTSSCNKCRHAF